MTVHGARCKFVDASFDTPIRPVVQRGRLLQIQLLANSAPPFHHYLKFAEW